MAIASIGAGLTGTEELDKNGQPKKPAVTTFNPINIPPAGQNATLQFGQDLSNQAPASGQASQGLGSFDPNADLSGQVTKAAQTTALQGNKTATQDLLSQQTQSLLKDPNAGVDLTKYNQNQMEQFDFNRQKALEAQRQKTADVSNTGQNIYDMTDLALRTNLDRSSLSNELEKQKQDTARANLVSALGEGRATAGVEQAGFTSGLAGLATAQSTGAQAKDQAFQWAMKNTDQTFSKEMATLQNKFTTGENVSARDFQSAQASLDRQQQTALQNNDIEAQKNITQLQNELSIQRDKQNQAFQEKMKGIDTASQKEIMNLKADIDSGLMMKGQDFEKTMKSLDQEFQKAMVSGDREQQVKILQLQQDFEKQQADADKLWKANESSLDRAWQSNEKLADKDFQAAQARIDRELKDAMQSKDIVSQQFLAGERNKLDLLMQTNGFTQQERTLYLQDQYAQSQQTNGYKIASNLQAEQNKLNQESMNLQAQIDEAKASGDVGRQQVLMDKQSEIDNSKMILGAQLDSAQKNKDYQHAIGLQDLQNKFEFTQQQSAQGHDVAMANLDAKLKDALAKGDTNNAIRLEGFKFQQQSEENAKDRALEQVRIDLQKKGLDMQEWEQQYNAIATAEANGTADPGASREFLNSKLEGTGIKLDPPDPQADYKAMQDEFKLQQNQYLMTHPTQGVLDPSKATALRAAHPEFVQYIDKATGKIDTRATDNRILAWALQNDPSAVTLSPAGAEDFNNFMNQSVYGEKSAESVANLDSTYRTKGAPAAITALGADRYSGGFGTTANLFTNEGGGMANVRYGEINNLPVGELQNLIDQMGNPGNTVRSLSWDERNNIVATAKDEMKKRKDMISKINSSSLTPEQKAEVKKQLPMLDLPW